MGARGPVPNRSEDLARPRSRKGGDQVEVTQGVARPRRWPEPDESWHQLAIDLYVACQESGQESYYQQSDIALLRSLMDDLSHYKKSGKRSGQMLQTIMSALSNLLVTEGDRRRVRIELQEPAEDENDAAIYAIQEYRSELDLDDDD